MCDHYSFMNWVLDSLCTQWAQNELSNSIKLWTTAIWSWLNLFHPLFKTLSFPAPIYLLCTFFIPPATNNLLHFMVWFFRFFYQCIQVVSLTCYSYNTIFNFEKTMWVNVTEFFSTKITDKVNDLHWFCKLFERLRFRNGFCDTWLCFIRIPTLNYHVISFVSIRRTRTHCSVSYERIT